MQSWDIDQNNRDYLMDRGLPVETNSLHVPAYIRLKVQKGAWLYAPDPNYGSQLYQLKRSVPPSTVEMAAIAALQPIIDDGRASEISVVNDAASRAGVGVNVSITEKNGSEDTLNLTGLGI